MFEALNNKQKFYQAAKEAHGNNPNQKNDLLTFHRMCDEAKVVPLPIFVKI